jgi:hypothetical protein
MKQTKKTEKKLMFKQDEHHISFEKNDEGTKIEIGDMKANLPLFTLSNVMSIIAWMNDLKIQKS